MMDRRSFASRILAAGAGLLGLRTGKAKASKRRWKRGDVVAWDWQKRLIWTILGTSKNGDTKILGGRPMRGLNFGRAFDARTGREVRKLRYYNRVSHHVERYGRLLDRDRVPEFKTTFGGLIFWGSSTERGSDPEIITETRRLRLEFADGRVVE